MHQRIQKEATKGTEASTRRITCYANENALSPTDAMIPRVQDPVAEAPAASLLMSGAVLRGAVALGLVAVLWALVAWALGFGA